MYKRHKRIDYEIGQKIYGILAKLSLSAPLLSCSKKVNV
jgi:hypothetical protein